MHGAGCRNPSNKGDPLMLCDRCPRNGRLISQFVYPALPRSGILQPWVFRYHLCRWHLAAWNRTRPQNQKKIEPIEWRSDNELLAGRCLTHIAKTAPTARLTSTKTTATQHILKKDHFFSGLLGRSGTYLYVRTFSKDKGWPKHD